MIAATIEEQGVTAGIEEYKRLRSEAPDDYDFAESELNNLGYFLLRDGDVEAAIAVFTLNTEQYPDAFNTFDSLGEAYKEAGQVELAIQNYERSLELNPGNQNGRRMLAELGVETDEAEGLVLPAEVLERYTGDYELQPGFVISISRDGNRLLAQATGQPQFELFAQSQTRFFLREVAAQIEFHLESSGPAVALTLFQNGQEVRGARVE